MGQIERYGVFALCLVIFLILGIAVWGGDGTKAVPDAAKNAIGAGAKEATPAPQDPAARDPFKPEPKREDAAKAPGAKEPALGTFPEVVGGDKNKGGAGTEPAHEPATDARAYVVKKDDTLDSIARKELKDSRAVEKILALNPGLDARKLQIGKSIQIPATAGTLRPETPEPAPRKDPADWPKKHKVAAHETLAAIARRYYGDEKQHGFLARANGVRDEHKLPIGTLLTIPEPRKP